MISEFLSADVMLAGLLGTTAYGVIVVDEERRILFANARAEEMFGYGEGELSGRSHDDLVPVESREKHTTESEKFFRRSRVRRMGIGLDLVGLRKDGSEFPVEIGLTPVETPDGTIVVTIVTDTTERRTNAEKLAEANLKTEEAYALLDEVFSAAPVGLAFSDKEHRILRINAVLAEIDGLSVSDHIGKKISEIMPELGLRIESIQQKVLETSQPVLDFEIEGATPSQPDVARIWRASWYPVSKGNRLVGVGAVVVEVTEQKRAEQATRQSEERYRRIVDTAEEGIWTIDGDNKADFVNAKMAQMLGYTAEEMIGKQLFDFMDEEGRKIATVNVERRRQGIREAHEFRLKRRTGSDIWVLMSTNPIVDAEGRYMGALAMATDITEQKQNRELIEHMAFHDLLTALPNRRLFADLAEQALATAARENQELAFLFLDLDGFKHINDTLGHDAGDSLLETIAGRLTKAVRQADIIARMGGDEFIVVLTNVKGATEAAKTTEKIMAELAQPFTLGKQAISPSASVGISLFPADGRRRETLVKRADLSLLRAKAEGKNSFRFYSRKAA